LVFIYIASQSNSSRNSKDVSFYSIPIPKWFALQPLSICLHIFCCCEYETSFVSL
jgi:hypothetical protein